jgi:hypothetical protein
MTTDELISQIKSNDEKVRTAAWREAGKVGADAVKPLAAVTTDKDLEVARAAQRAMWQIVRYTGRPGADSEKKAVGASLILLLGDDQPAAVRREVLWMLSEIAGDEAVGPMAALLSNAELREDARLCLQRIPGDKALQALKDALAAAPEDFKINVAESLRARGVEVPGLPCQKLVPTKTTSVKPVGR